LLTRGAALAAKSWRNRRKVAKEQLSWLQQFARDAQSRYEKGRLLGSLHGIAATPAQLVGQFAAVWTVRCRVCCKAGEAELEI